MGPIKTIKKKKRAEKKVDRNVLLAAAAAAAAASASASAVALNSEDDDSSSQSLDWWDGFSRRFSGISLLSCCFLLLALASNLPDCGFCFVETCNLNAHGMRKFIRIIVRFRLRLVM